MTIELHTWNTPNGRKISVALEEMGLPYKVVPVNISKGEQMAPDFLKLSPNNKIPAILDPEGPDGKPVSLFESGAILLYLGEKTGKFLPKSLAGRIPVYEWLMWQMGGFGPMPGQVHHFIALENEQDRAYGLKRYMAETRRLYGVLDRRLADRDFVAGEISVADFAILGWAWRHPRHKVELAGRFPQRQALVRGPDGPPGGEAGHGSKAGLRFLLPPPCGGGWLAAQRRDGCGVCLAELTCICARGENHHPVLRATFSARGEGRKQSHLLRFHRHPHREPGQHRAHQPALHQHPARPTRQKQRD
ncbi:glutathione S-transferase [Bradyrhizobium sp. LB7.1]